MCFTKKQKIEVQYLYEIIIQYATGEPRGEFRGLSVFFHCFTKKNFFYNRPPASCSRPPRRLILNKQKLNTFLNGSCLINNINTEVKLEQTR